MKTLLLAFLTAAYLAPVTGDLIPVTLINAGYHPVQGDYEDSQGRIWSPDPTPNNPNSIHGWRHIKDPDTDIIGTEDDELYRYNRWKLERDGSLFYNIEVPNDSYSIELHFAELRRTGANQRVFDILIEGNLVTPEYDCFEAAGGADKAVILQYNSIAVTGGALNIEFRPVVGEAMISAIGVFLPSDTGPIPSTPRPSPAPTPAPVTGDLVPVTLINAGYHPVQGDYEDSQGRIWSSDPTPNKPNSIHGWRHIKDPDTDIIGTEDDELYRYYRWKLERDGSLFYNIEVPNDNYTIQLYFAELRKTGANQRVFDILIEGNLVTSAYDCFEAAGGADKADVLQYTSIAVTGGALNIEFRPIVGEVMISAIGVFLPSDTEPTPPSPRPSPSPTPGPSPSPTPAPTPSPSWGGGIPDDFQPRVIDVEAYNPHRAQGFIGIPGGSIWCQGRAAYWWSGHDNQPEEPFCEEADGTWTKSSTAVLNRQDALNVLDGPTYIDRHDCVAFDANSDGTDDIICVVGANVGTGYGYNEVYYTNPVDGSIEREMNDVGLYKYNTMRTRFIQTLTAFDGGRMVAIATTGGSRADGQSNAHRMFRLNATNGFDEVEGPFNDDFWGLCLEVVDINNDGVDDLIICDQIAKSHAYIQNPRNGAWTELDWSAFDDDIVEGWNGARVADVTGDGVADLVVAGPWHNWLDRNPDPYVRVYPGKPTLPWAFDFDNPVLDETLPHESMDIELIDLNDDGLLDIYAVQWDLTEGQGDYCQLRWSHGDWWDGPHGFPPADFVPPGDRAPDYLYLSIDGASWDPIVMEHSVPGCGFRVQKWKDKSLAVAHGHLTRPGFNVILDWS